MNKRLLVNSIFNDSSKRSFKCAPLHNDNFYSAVPTEHSAYLREEHEDVKRILDQQRGYIKHFFFLCLRVGMITELEISIGCRKFGPHDLTWGWVISTFYLSPSFTERHLYSHFCTFNWCNEEIRCKFLTTERDCFKYRIVTFHRLKRKKIRRVFLMA